MIEIIYRELIYIWYYFDIQLRQIFWYWILGIVIGSIVSIFAKDKIHNLFSSINGDKQIILKILFASFLGILSPLCMYGTVPIAASLAKKGMREDVLSAFMMSSILLNPQLLMYSFALGNLVMCIRLITCFICGIVAGLLVLIFFKHKKFFDFKNFEEIKNNDTDPNIIIKLFKNIGRNIKATGIYFFIGILLSALFQRYIPKEAFASLFGKKNEGFGLLMSATIGVPLYACGGGTIPLLQAWLVDGMSIGSAAAFMITGPATKITNLGALKISMGIKHFIYYLIFIMIFALISGMIINMIF
ncbi:MAG: permease [Eubacteriales bacterium]|nr:permease [Eubacteriales bacterium]